VISAICPTYNRAPHELSLLGEAVESFLRQDFPDKELVILNDCPDQTLSCDAPGVRVINLPQRIGSLGEKYNALVELSRGGLILPWEDDDISLPWRMSQAWESLQGYAYFNPQRTWFLDGVGWHRDHSHGVCHNGSAFTRDAWRKVGGYPPASGNQDWLMDVRLKSLNSTAPPLGNDARQWSYVYRWGVSSFHLSGQSDTGLAWVRHGSRAALAGSWRVTPRWLDDYVRCSVAALSDRL